MALEYTVHQREFLEDEDKITGLAAWAVRSDNRFADQLRRKLHLSRTNNPRPEQLRAIRVYLRSGTEDRGLVIRLIYHFSNLG